VAHEQPEVASGSETALGVLGGRGRVVGEREGLIGSCDVVGCAGEQVQRTLDPAELDVLAADLKLAGDQLVVAEEVLDDPEIEGAGDRLRVLEPVLELAVPLQVGGKSIAPRRSSAC
jgi:hypothetical protein